MLVLVLGDLDTFQQISESFTITYDPGELVDAVVSSTTSIQYAPHDVPIFILSSGGISDWKAKQIRPEAVICNSVFEIIDNLTQIRVEEAPIETRDSLLVVSYANKGGVGKTTAACSIASTMADYGIPTAIADFDFGGPDVGTFFDINKTPNNFLGEKDISKFLITPIKNLNVLPTPKKINPTTITAHQLLAVVNQLKHRFPVVIVDTCPAPWQEDYIHPIFAQADIVYAIVNQSKFSLDETKNYAPELLAMGVKPEHIRIIINQYSPKLASQKAIEQAFCERFKKGTRYLPKVSAIIPEGWENQVRALNKGKLTYPEEWRKVCKEITNRLKPSFHIDNVVVEKSGLLKKIFNR